MTQDYELLEQVVLLALLHKEPDESVQDILAMLEESRAMTTAEGKEIISNLEKEGAIVDGKLSFIGMALANKAQEAFKL
ncbi:MAG: hypothetical protein PHV08_01685 [Sulfurovaceae bacterium]|nr:hypothetical protein [Sulfurovaceae bacterium]